MATTEIWHFLERKISSNQYYIVFFSSLDQPYSNFGPIIPLHLFKMEH